LKLIVFTIPRTGTHVIGRAAKINGYKVIHEPFTPGEEYQNYKKFIKKVVLPSEKIVVLDHYFVNSEYDRNYFNNCIRDYDLKIVLLRRDKLQQAISAVYASIHLSEDWNSKKRIPAQLPINLVEIKFRNLIRSENVLRKLNLPIFYYEDIIADPSIFPIKLTVEDYRPPAQSSYILNYEKIRSKSANWQTATG
jgi:hypothetical protein